MERTKIIIATGNPHKIKEIESFLHNDFEIISQNEIGIDEIEETGKSFIENAILKARNACEISSSLSLADDSGLVVPALGGSPGIFSARYSDELTDSANRKKLLQEMRSLVDDERKAYYCCSIALYAPQIASTPLIIQRFWHGSIAHEEFGDGGFGYDSVFIADETNISVAQLSSHQKNKLSHRAKAMRELVHQLPKFLLLIEKTKA